jgi:hypothetical protein
MLLKCEIDVLYPCTFDDIPFLNDCKKFNIFVCLNYKKIIIYMLENYPLQSFKSWQLRGPLHWDCWINEGFAKSKWKDPK